MLRSVVRPWSSRIFYFHRGAPHANEMLGEIQETHARQTDSADFAQRRDMRAAFDEVIPEFALERARHLAGMARDPGGCDHFRVPMAAFIGLLFPIGKEGLFITVEAHFSRVFTGQGGIAFDYPPAMAVPHTQTDTPYVAKA